MPVVTIRYDEEFVADELLGTLPGITQVLVAAGLHVDPRDGEGQLMPDDVEVFMLPTGPYDLPSCDITVAVEAMRYPARLANLQQRTEAIQRALDDLYPQVTVSVWITLHDAGWASSAGESPRDDAMDKVMADAISRAQAVIRGDQP